MPKILVIEDEASIRRVLIKILSEENDSYVVEEAEDGLQGLEKIKNEDYDLVLCDIKMPKMDGEEVLEAARDIKIPILITKYPMYEACGKLFAAGLAGCSRKEDSII